MADEELSDLYAPPTAASREVTNPGVKNRYYVSGDFVVCEPGVRLPERCVLTNADGDNVMRRTKKFVWVSPWIYLSLLINIIILLILYFWLRKTAMISFSINRSLRRKSMVLKTFAIIAVISGFFLGIGGLAMEQPGTALIGFGLFIGGIVMSYKSRTIWVRKYKDGWFYLKGFSQEYRDQIQEEVQHLMSATEASVEP